jgi:hypothetical protein
MMTNAQIEQVEKKLDLLKLQLQNLISKHDSDDLTAIHDYVECARLRGHSLVVKTKALNSIEETKFSRYYFTLRSRDVILSRVRSSGDYRVRLRAIPGEGFVTKDIDLAYETGIKMSTSIL